VSSLLLITSSDTLLFQTPCWQHDWGASLQPRQVKSLGFHFVLLVGLEVGCSFSSGAWQEQKGFV
jgi:hypothetical protein